MRAAALRRPGTADVLAGVTVAVVLVPQSLAYAQLAGFPASRGLFAAAIPPLVAAPLASSAYLQPGPTAVSALLTYGALAPLAPPGSRRYVELGLLLALLVGAVRLAVGFLRAGVLAHLLSEPLLAGFVPAAALLICASQLPTALGVAGGGGNEIAAAARAIWHVHDWRPGAVGAALCTAAIAVLGRRVHPLFPGVLLAIVAGVAVGATGLDVGPEVAHVGASAPPLTRSLPLDAMPRLVVPALVIAILGFAEAASIARTYAALDRQRWSADREFVSQGAANVAAGLFGGFPVGASFSRSALNRLAGARSSASGIVTGLCVLAFLPLGFLVDGLPRAVLAATVVVAVVPLIRLDRIAAIARASPVQATVALTAFVLTLALAPHLERAIVAAVALSLAIHLWRELRLDVVASSSGPRLDLTPQGVLWFGTARQLEDRFVDLLAAHPDARELVLHLDSLGRIDLTGALALQRLVGDARGAGLSVSVRGTPPHADRVLGRVLEG